MRLLAFLFVGLGACHAEDLGVELPRGGPDAVSMEDLQRDTQLLSAPRDGGQRGPAVPQRFAQRLGQMRMVPAFGKVWEHALGEDVVLVCGERDGAGDEGVTVIAVGSRDGASGAVQMAGLVSLAKCFDTPTRPSKTVRLCGWFGETQAVVPETLSDAIASDSVGVFHMSGDQSDTALHWLSGDESLTLAVSRFGTASASSVEHADLRGMHRYVERAYAEVIAVER